MKDLISNIKTAIETGVSSGRIRTCTVFKGIREDPSQIPIIQFPYVCLDDGGETYEDTAKAQDSGIRTYKVLFEFAVYQASIEGSLEELLDFSDELRNELERSENRFKDGMTWGVDIAPYYWENDKMFFRARMMTIEYTELELKDFSEY